MPRKKIVFVIVEGLSDEDAIGALLTRIYNKNEVHVEVVHGDITTDYDVNPNNILAKVGKLVKNYAGKIFKPKDFERIIHITDTDGVYIPDENIIEDAAMKKPFYTVTDIRTMDKEKIVKRNKRKRENLNRLSTTPEIWKVPYQIYYMSCNLDHVLYGKQNSSDEEKERDSLIFAKKYMDDIPGFVKFIAESEFSVADGYPQSWQFIREELHSLERYTNFGLCITEPADAAAKTLAE